MPFALPFAAQQTWPEAAVAIAGIALVGGVIVVIVWQALETWRARIAVAREEAHRRLAEDLASELRQLDARLQRLEARLEGGATEGERR